MGSGNLGTTAHGHLAHAHGLLFVTSGIRLNAQLIGRRVAEAQLFEGLIDIIYPDDFTVPSGLQLLPNVGVFFTLSARGQQHTRVAFKEVSSTGYTLYDELL